MGHAVHWYINQVRLDKPDLFGAIQKETSFANARLQSQEQGRPEPQLHHYLRFNFKAAFVSDEKQEQLVSVLMDANSGQPAWGLDRVWGQVFLEQEPQLTDIRQAPLAWYPGPSNEDPGTWNVQATPPLTVDVLRALQERAAQAVAR